MAGETSPLEALGAAIDKLQLKCDQTGCTEPAAVTIRCRYQPLGCSVVCASHLALLEKAVEAIGHLHCAHCGEAGRVLAEIATVTNLREGLENG